MSDYNSNFSGIRLLNYYFLSQDWLKRIYPMHDCFPEPEQFMLSLITDIADTMGYLTQVSTNNQSVNFPISFKSVFP